MEGWKIKSSIFATATENPLRRIHEREQPLPNPEKSVIMLQPGDPTAFGNFKAHPEWIRILSEAAVEDTFSYNMSRGLPAALQAVAEYSQHLGKVTAEDVILTSGASMAIEMCFLALADPGENILIPRPAFNYTTWASGPGIELKAYNLDPEADWNVDLAHMESLIDEKTRGILVNQPGNPCGNVYTKEHILEIIAIAERHKLPIIADEVYEFFVYPGFKSYSVAGLSKNVPVLTASGLTKRFLMPGIRMGWLIICDRGDKLKELVPGLHNVCSRNFGPSSIVQLALPKILKFLPEKFFAEVNERAGNNALITYKLLKAIPGINPIMPKGGIFLMFGIDFKKFPKFSSSFDFFRALANDQSVFAFPSECFNYGGFLRICITAPEEMLIEACERIKEFCSKHFDDKHV